MNEESKKAAALEAVKLVKNHSVIGVGTGSTVKPFIEALNNRVEKEKLNLSAVPTSNESKNALHKDIKVIELTSDTPIDICVDGADRASNDFFLIKGGGGALVREKFVALNASFNITIIDETKISSPLAGFPLPVEIVPFGYNCTIKRLHEKNFSGTLRKTEGKAFVTDNGNYIYDIELKRPINDPILLHAELKAVSGVVETGLFLRTSDIIIIGKNDLSVDVWKKR